MPEYYTAYLILPAKGDSDNQDDDEPTSHGSPDRFGVDRQEPTVFYRHLGKSLPKACTDRLKRRYKLRSDRKKQPLWRTHLYAQTEGEPFYFQKIILNYAIRSEALDSLFAIYGSWRSAFFAVCDEERCRLSAEEVEEIKRLDTIISSQSGTTQLSNSNGIAMEERLENTLTMMNTSQKYIYDFITEDLRSSSNVYMIYGAAGTGKSFVLNALKLYLTLQQLQPIVLAPTGVAAHSVSGQTIHRFFGFTLNIDVYNPVRLEDYLKIHPKIVLLIDEISMISRSLMEKMSCSLSEVTGNGGVFGGLPVIMFGDVSQLPPVQVQQEGYFFRSPIMDGVVSFLLTEPQRVNEEDAEFLQFLHKVKNVQLDDFVLRFINNRRVKDNDVDMDWLRLFPTRAEVHEYNDQCIDRIEGPGKWYASIDVGPEYVLKETGKVKNLFLKKGVPVMLLENLAVDDGWVNGTRCVVESIEADNMLVLKRIKDGRTRPVQYTCTPIYRTNWSRTQLPVAIGFASTVHKVQSLTLDDGVVVSLNRSFFAHGEFYVACSRVRSGSQIRFSRVNLEQLRVAFDKLALSLVEGLERTFDGRSQIN